MKYIELTALIFYIGLFFVAFVCIVIIIVVGIYETINKNIKSVDKKYICGDCFKINNTNKLNGLCKCGADNWYQSEDFFSADYSDTMTLIAKRLNITRHELYILLTD